MITIETLFLVISELFDVTADLPSVFHTGREMTRFTGTCGLNSTDWLTSPSWSNQDQSFYLILDLFGFVSYHDN